MKDTSITLEPPQWPIEYRILFTIQMFELFDSPFLPMLSILVSLSNGCGSAFAVARVAAGFH